MRVIRWRQEVAAIARVKSALSLVRARSALTTPRDRGGITRRIVFRWGYEMEVERR